MKTCKIIICLIISQLLIHKISFSQKWDILGNSGTTPGTNFVGNTDNVDLVFKTNNTENVRIQTSGNVGIGTNNPTTIIGINGDATRTIQMERHTTSNTAGNNLTVQSGGATSGATNKDGGSLQLSSGTSTGTGTSIMQFSTATAGGSGTLIEHPQ